MYNGLFKQCLEVIISSNSHDECLHIAKIIKKQCEAWDFCVRYDEHKSARKGDVLKRDIMIYQTAYASDIVIFKEAIKRICSHLDVFNEQVKFIDRGTETDNDLRQSH